MSSNPKGWLAAALGAVSLLAGTSPVGAAAPENQTFDGTLLFCEPACEIGTLTAEGPIHGTASVEIINDRSNRRFSVTQAQVRLTIGGTDTVTLDITLRSIDREDPDPCRIAFNEDGRWRITSGTGLYADMQGEGLLHNHGLAIDHDPSCDGAPYSSIDWHLTGRAHDHSS